MKNELDDTQIYSASQLAEIYQMFKYMVEGQGVAFWVVDPGVTSRRITAKAIEQNGFDDIYEVRSAEEALQSLAQASFPKYVTFVDEAMVTSSGMNCMEYMRKFRQIAPDGVVFLTLSRYSPARAAEAISQGVAAVLTRPLTPEIIGEKLIEFNIKKA